MSSFLGKTTIPFWTTYNATKHGTTGLMDGLVSLLNFYEFDFIKTTTVYPFFVSTRDDLIQLLEDFRTPFISPEYLSKIVVDGVKKDVRSIYVPSFTKLFLLERWEIISINITSLISFESDSFQRKFHFLWEICQLSVLREEKRFVKRE